MYKYAFAVILNSFTAIMFTVVHAAPISVGALSTNTDGSTEVISDSLNNYEWLRLDVLADLNYTETLAIISAGGSYEGWNIAHNAQAQEFINAMFSPADPLCEINISFQCGIANYNNGDFGNTFTSDADLIFFISDNNISHEVGLITLSTSEITKDDEWGSFADSNNFSASGSQAAIPISWLLFRDNNPVTQITEPGSLALFILGVFGHILIKRKTRLRIHTKKQNLPQWKSSSV